MNIKQQLYNQCLAFIQNRYTTVQNTIYEIQESLTSETKSSAGDKHETGRAMLQLEREKAGHQLAEIEKTKLLLSKVNTETTSNSIGLGSVVYTTKANYFIAISAGELTIDDDKFYAISANTPIAKLLLLKQIGDEIHFRSSTFVINRIL
ncbi:3-oxoacyl-ACP synthase [Algibacter sp. R77976]|uniref:3-oxoacyl-ACP synthase n=1 Tax=Algibacter sp. R77976 TaxID=3093873 RepID=UPI0037CC92C7